MIGGMFNRSPNNPILTAKDWPYPVNSVFNPGAVMLQDGTTILLCRVEDFRGHSHLTAARSANGVDGWKIDLEGSLMPDAKNHPEEIWGVEDPRITYLPDMKKYAVTYTSYGEGGPGVSLAVTTDFHVYQRLGVVMQPEDKDAALFPRKINGRWALIHRPVTPMGANIWISYSPDLRYWGEHKMIIRARRGAWWDANKVGLCCPPIETPRGWLILYHGVRMNAAGCLYRVGAALMDLQDPEKCLLRGDEWLIGPEAPYEIRGDVSNVVFPCGYTLLPDGDTLRLYYGAADTSIGLISGSVKKILGWLEHQGAPAADSRRPTLKQAGGVVKPG